jgi:hypothetical protein
MSPPSAGPKIFERIVYWVSASRFLTISLIVHLIAILVIGGAVLYKAMEMRPEFEADSRGLVDEADVAEPPPEPVEREVLEQFSQQAPVLTAPLIAITSNSVASTRAVFALPNARVNGMSGARNGAGLPPGDSLLKGGAMGAGGLARLGGSKMAMIFGKKISARKLGVILDVSGSAHPYLAGAIAEIQKGFADATLILYPGCGLTSFEGKSGHVIRKYSSITKREIERGRGDFSTSSDIVEVLEIKEFEEMTKRSTVKNNLFVSWFDEKGGSADELIGRTQVAFDDLMKRGVDTIYWFADFTDRIDGEVVSTLSSQLGKRKIVLHVHNFAGDRINSMITDMAEESGGTVSTDRPR